MFFKHPPAETTRQVAATELKANVRRVLDDVASGIVTQVTRHSQTVVVMVPPSMHEALMNFRRSVKQAFDSCYRQLERIQNCPDGASRPTPHVIAAMETLLEELESVLDIGPSRIVATVDGGLDAYFFSAVRTGDGSPARYVSISVDSDRDASVLLSSGPEAEAEDLGPGTDARSLAARITEFLSGVEETEPARS